MRLREFRFFSLPFPAPLRKLLLVLSEFFELFRVPYSRLGFVPPGKSKTIPIFPIFFSLLSNRFKGHRQVYAILPLLMIAAQFLLYVCSCGPLTF